MRHHARRLLAIGSSALLASSVLALAGPPATATSDRAATKVPRMDNGRLVFTRLVPFGSDEHLNAIFTANPDGTGVRRLTRGGENNGPKWGPAGRRIVYSHNADIWLMGGGGGHQRRLVGGGPEFGFEPAWAPHGRRIVFVMNFTALAVYSLRTGKLRRVPGDFARPSHPTWSPNGRRILFAGTRPGPSETADIYSIRPDGARLRNLTETRRAFERNPDWSPSGRRIVYAREGRNGIGCRVLYTMRTDGSGNTRVPGSCPADSPAWSPDGRLVAFNNLPAGFSFGLSTMRLDGTDRTLVTEGWSADWQPRPPRN